MYASRGNKIDYDIAGLDNNMPCRFVLVCSGGEEEEEEYITFEEAISILRLELNYPPERALHFVRRFDRNNDGKLSMAEFNLFRKKIEET